MSGDIRTVKQLYDECVKNNIENYEIRCLFKSWDNEEYIGELMAGPYPFTHNDQDKCIHLYFDQKYKRELKTYRLY